MAILNLSNLYTLMNGDEAMVRRLLDIFCEKSPEQLAEIEHFIVQKDWVSTETAVHSFKAQLGYLASEDETALAKALETAAMERNEIKVKSLFQQLRQVTYQIISEIKQ